MQLPTLGTTAQRHRGLQVREFLGGDFELMFAELADDGGNSLRNINDQRVFGNFVKATQKLVQNPQRVKDINDLVSRKRWMALRELILGWKTVAPVGSYDGENEFRRLPCQDTNEKHLQGPEFVSQGLHLR